jgi:hypothetical protein
MTIESATRPQKRFHPYLSQITKEMDPKDFFELASTNPTVIKRSKFIISRKMGNGFRAKVLVEFTHGTRR